MHRIIRKSQGSKISFNCAIFQVFQQRRSCVYFLFFKFRHHAKQRIIKKVIHLQLNIDKFFMFDFDSLSIADFSQLRGRLAALCCF